MKRTRQAVALEAVVVFVCAGATSVLVTLVLYGVFGVDGWWLRIAQAVIGGVVGWRVAGWSERQDDLEAKRSEVDR